MSSSSCGDGLLLAGGFWLMATAVPPAPFCGDGNVFFGSSGFLKKGY
jgi:hypothetical protein